MLPAGICERFGSGNPTQFIKRLVSRKAVTEHLLHHLACVTLRSALMMCKLVTSSFQLQVLLLMSADTSLGLNKSRLQILTGINLDLRTKALTVCGLMLRTIAT
jgi:hypothetical protein